MLVAAIVAAGSMAAAALASATVTSTQITSPATNSVFSNPNLLGPAEALAFSGTSDGSAGDMVDVFCVYTVPRQAANHSTTPLATVTVQDGDGFSGSVTLQSFDWDRCTLIAVPHGAGPAAAPPANYNGPEISNGRLQGLQAFGWAERRRDPGRLPGVGRAGRTLGYVLRR